MTELVLIIDSGSELEKSAKSALLGKDVRCVCVPDIPAAKRKLIQETPSVILASLKAGAESLAGIRFIEELKQHQQLKAVPVIFAPEELDEEVINLARDAGAAGVIPTPIDPVILEYRLRPLLKALTEVQSETEVPKPAPAIGEREEKLKVAQNLLARVLHSFKTSALVDIIELDEVPRVISEITRTICGITGTPAPAAGDDSVDNGKGASEDKETKIELEAAFKTSK